MEKMRRRKGDGKGDDGAEVGRGGNRGKDKEEGRRRLGRTEKKRCSSKSRWMGWGRKSI